jgi:hypothetical protein
MGGRLCLLSALPLALKAASLIDILRFAAKT